MEPDTAEANQGQRWQSVLNALPGTQIGLVDETGTLLEAPKWLTASPSPWTAASDLYDPLHQSDRARVRAALARAQGDQGQATTVARLAGSATWSLLSFLDTTDNNGADGSGVDGIVVAWVPSLDQPQLTLAEVSPGENPVHGPWLTELRTDDGDAQTGWIDDELGPATERATTGPADRELGDNEATALRLEIEDLPVPAAFLDPQGEFAVANRRWYQLLGITMGNGSGWLDVFDADDIARLEALAATSSEVDTTVRLPDEGETRWIRIRGLSRPEHRGAGGVWILDDVTDNVTLVGTVADLERQLATSGSADPDEGTTAAVLVVGIEGLGRVRTAHGETAADLVLTATNERLRTVVRPHDHVGQLASDEFAVVCTRMRGGDGALSVANRIMTELESSFEIGDDQFSLSASIGVAITDDPSIDPGQLLDEAAAARNDARRNGVAIAPAHRSG
ncbi:MAG: diguanylate cyclase domain-containing protein [Acidimicrobiales bacterium]